MSIIFIVPFSTFERYLGFFCFDVINMSDFWITLHSKLPVMMHSFIILFAFNKYLHSTKFFVFEVSAIESGLILNVVKMKKVSMFDEGIKLKLRDDFINLVISYDFNWLVNWKRI